LSVSSQRSLVQTVYSSGTGLEKPGSLKKQLWQQHEKEYLNISKLGTNSLSILFFFKHTLSLALFTSISGSQKHLLCCRAWLLQRS